jgi:hypothetical protein
LYGEEYKFKQRVKIFMHLNKLSEKEYQMQQGPRGKIGKHGDKNTVFFAPLNFV